jgi:hypothetical protein
LADHQVIKEHLDGGQVLLDRLRRTGMLLFLAELNPRSRQGEAILSRNCQGRNQKRILTEGHGQMMGIR